MPVSSSPRTRAVGAILAVLLTHGGASGQAVLSDNSTLAAQRGRPRRMTLGPVAGLTTAWHPAPAITHIPLGTSVRLRQFARRDDVVTWHGAQEILRDAHGSVAVSPGTDGGRRFIRALVSSPDGSRYESSIVIDRVEVPTKDAIVGRQWARLMLRDEVDRCREAGALERVDPGRPGGFRAFLYGVARHVAQRFERKDARRKVRPRSRW